MPGAACCREIIRADLIGASTTCPSLEREKYMSGMTVKNNERISPKEARSNKVGNAVTT